MFSITDHCEGWLPNESNTKEIFSEKHIASGFRMTFSNGNTISVQFGAGNYCDNRHQSKPTCEDAEIAIWNKDSEWYDFGTDTVKGYCTPEDVAYWINYAANNIF